MRIHPECFGRDGCTQAFTDLECPAQFRLRHDDDELFTSEATRQIDAACVAPKARRKIAQHRIAGVMAVRVIDALEVIDIGNQERDGAAGLVRLGYQRRQMRFHITAIVEPSQTIGDGHFHAFLDAIA